MSQSLSQKVLAFQTHVGAPTPAWDLVLPCPDVLEMIKAECALEDMSRVFKRLFAKTNHQPFLRMELILEELGELCAALHAGDQREALDAVVDLAYVVIGTATQLDLPFDAGFDEVHRSNMTKSSSAARHAGDKGKGPSFSPANLEAILEQHRKRNHATEV